MKRNGVVASLLMASLLLACPAKSQVLEAVGYSAIGGGLGALGGSIGEALDNLMERSEILTANLASRGDILGASIAARLEVLVRNAQIRLDDQLDRSLDQLEPWMENILLELAAVHDSIDTAARTAIHLSDYLALDLENTSWLIRGVDHEEFLIRRVEGYVLRQRKRPYSMSIRGRGVGLGTGNQSSKLDVYVVGKKTSNRMRIPDRALLKVGQYDLKVSIPTEFLASSFEESAIERATLVIEAEITSSRMIGPDKVKRYSQEIPLLLLPLVGAELTPSVLRQENHWNEENVRIQPLEHTTPHAKTEQPHIFNRVESFGLDQRIVGVRYGCVGSGCPWCYNPNYKPGTPHPEPGIEYSASYQIRSEEREVHLSRYCDGKSATLRWEILYVERSEVSIQEELGSLKVGLGEEFEILLPPGTIDWSISGHLFSGDPISAKKGSVGGYLEHVRSVPVGRQQRLVLRLVGE